MSLAGDAVVSISYSAEFVKFWWSLAWNEH